MITLDIAEGKGFRALFRYDEELVRRIKEVPGFKWNKRAKVWYSEGPEVLIEMERAALPYQMTVTAAQRAKDFHARFMRILDLKVAQYEKSEQFAYQADGAEALVLQERGILADEMGLGKSKQSLDACALAGLLDILVIAPKSLLFNWAEEVDKWHADWDVTIIQPAPKRRKEDETPLPRYAFATSPHLEEPERPRVVICNYERLGAWALRNWDAIIIDEASRLKNPRTNTHKAIAKLAERVPYVFALTGTPLELRVEELYGIMSLVRPAVFGHWGRFRAAHLETDWSGRVTGAKNLTLLKERAGPWMFRRTKLQVAKQLPPKLPPVFIYPEMEGEELTEYQALVRDFDNWESPTGMVGTDSIITKMLRMQQFTSTPASLGYDWVGAKYLELWQLLEGWDGMALVFVHFRKSAELIQGWLDLPERAIIHGGINDAMERQERIRLFNAGELGKTFISTDAGAYGLNITGPDLIVHYDKLWNPAKERQREDRLHRWGQTKPVNVAYLLNRHTIDVGMHLVTQARSELFDELIARSDEALISRYRPADFGRIVRGEMAA